MVISLDAKERDKFVAYLEQEAVTNKGMAEQMEKLKVHNVMVQKLKMKAAACIIIALDLRGIEDMTIGGK